MISYHTKCSEITDKMLHGFFVGWPNPPSPEAHFRILQQSDYVVLAVDDETNRVVGFVTAISDKVLSAYIPLLEVLPEYQYRGIGRELMERMLIQLDGLYMIDLTCDPKLQKAYRQLGFQKMTAMMIRRFDCQSGRTA